MSELLKRLVAAETGETLDDSDDMCPNCVTPWKCNGPHLHEQTKAYRDNPHEATLDEAWAEAEDACASEPQRRDMGMPSWPRLQGPFNSGLYQADVMEPDGHRRDDERIGLGPTPTAALRALAVALRSEPLPSKEKRA